MLFFSLGAKAQSLPSQTEVCGIIDVLIAEGPKGFKAFKGSATGVPGWSKCTSPKGASFCKLEDITRSSNDKRYSIRFGWQASSMGKAAQVASQLANLSNNCNKGEMDADTDVSYDPDEHRWRIVIDGLRDDDRISDFMSIKFYADEARGRNMAYMRTFYGRKSY